MNSQSVSAVAPTGDCRCQQRRNSSANRRSYLETQRDAGIAHLGSEQFGHKAGVKCEDHSLANADPVTGLCLETDMNPHRRDDDNSDHNRAMRGRMLDASIDVRVHAGADITSWPYFAGFGIMRPSIISWVTALP